jgi:putative peptidoglycan lipid II flippase
LLRRGSYRPAPGWGIFALQVFAGAALLGVFLTWAAHSFPWTAWRGEPWKRIGMMAATLAGAGLIYFGALMAAGVKLRQFVTR